MDIPYLQAFAPEFLERTETLRDLLVSDVYSGPAYLTESEEASEESFTWDGETYHTCGWAGEEITGNLFGSKPHRELVREIEGINLPGFFDASFGEFLDREPEGYEDEDTGEWVDPCFEDIYQLETSDFMAAIFGPRTWRDIMGVR